jgi:acetyl-CoA C-acetyltransferase/acetyl-CoA acyltransferase
MSTEAAFVINGVRTPFARAGGALAALPAEDLGVRVARELLLRSGVDPASIDGVIAGHAGPGPGLAEIARVISWRAGLPESVPALTVHRGGASGLDAITTAADMVAAGRGSLYLAVGCESMSHLLADRGARTRTFARGLQPTRSRALRLPTSGRFRSRARASRSTFCDQFADPAIGSGMGESSELIARRWGVSRDTQDSWALRSHQRARDARTRLRAETCDVLHDRGVLRDDDTVRDDASREAFAGLRPELVERHGTITCGNSSPAADGAVAMLIGSPEGCRAAGLEPLGRIERFTYVGCDPSLPGLGPVHAIHHLFPSRTRPFPDIDLVEIHEAFAAQLLADLAALRDPRFCRELGREQPLGEIPEERLNVNGGAIALGHPVGATGTRLVLTALQELRRREARRALVALPIEGGQGAAMLLRRD